MVLEVYYLDYANAIPAAQQINYVNILQTDKQTTDSTMSEGILYNPDGSVGGNTEITSFTRKGVNTAVTSLFTVFTDSGLLVFNIARLYTPNYNPIGDSVKAVATYQSGIYATGSPVYMSLDAEVIATNIILKLSITY